MALDPAVYAAIIHDTIASRDSVPAWAMKSIAGPLTHARLDLIDQLAHLPAGSDGTWQMMQLAQARAAIERTLADLDQPITDALTTAAVRSANLGTGIVATALKGAGDAELAGRLTFGAISTPQALALTRVYPALVKGLTADWTNELARTLQQGILTTRPAHKIMGDMQKLLDTPSRPTERFGKLYNQAERVFVTEVNRTYAIGTEIAYGMTTDKLGKDGFVRVWQHAGGGTPPRWPHVKLHGTHVPYEGGLFDVNGHRAAYPKAPELPASEVIYCRCTVLLWNLAWGDPAFGAFPPGSDAAEGKGAWKSPKAQPGEAQALKPTAPPPAPPPLPELQPPSTTNKPPKAPKAPKEPKAAKGTANREGAAPGDMDFWARSVWQAEHGWYPPDVRTPEDRGSSRNAHDRMLRQIDRAAGLQPGTAYDVSQNWAAWSNDHNINSLTLQKAASAEFGVPLSDWQKRRLADVVATGQEPRYSEDELRRLLRAMHNQTQAELAKAGITEIQVARGFRSPLGEVPEPGTIIRTTTNALESWTYNIGVADEFGDMTVLQRVPAKSVLGWYQTGIGTDHEFELVLIGARTGSTRVKVWDRMD